MPIALPATRRIANGARPSCTKEIRHRPVLIASA